jgi:hypothetical protein
MNDYVTSWITGIKSCRGFNDGENRNAGFLWLNTIPRPKFKLAFVPTIAVVSECPLARFDSTYNRGVRNSKESRTLARESILESQIRIKNH